MLPGFDLINNTVIDELVQLYIVAKVDPLPELEAKKQRRFITSYQDSCERVYSYTCAYPRVERQQLMPKTPEEEKRFSTNIYWMLQLRGLNAVIESRQRAMPHPTFTNDDFLLAEQEINDMHEKGNKGQAYE